MKKFIATALLTMIFFPAYCQVWKWTYNTYDNGGYAIGGSVIGVGDVELRRKVDNFYINISIPQSTAGDGVCSRGNILADVSILNNDLIILYQSEVGGCEKFRLTLKKDGSGGDMEYLADGKWTLFLKNQPRGLKTRSAEELTTLYKLLGSLNKVTITDANTNGNIVNQVSVKDKGGDSDSPKIKAEKDRYDAERLARIQAEAALSKHQLALANEALLESEKKTEELARIKTELEKFKRASTNTQPLAVTANPLDQVKKTNGNEVWISFNPSITVQERQFCRIVENFRTENALAAQSNNKIKVNETYRGLTQSLNSLLPDGKFQGWVMRMVAVDQAADGSAEVLLELPCNIYVGSNACDVSPKNYYGTAPEGSRMYTELAKMTVGDFALTSGQFVYTDDKAFDKNRSVASFRFMRTGAHCKAKKISTDSEFFGTKLDVISTIK